MQLKPVELPGRLIAVAAAQPFRPPAVLTDRGLHRRRHMTRPQEIASPPTNSGQILRRLVLEDFALFEMTYPSGQRVRPHRHEKPQIAILLRGWCRERIAGRDEICEPVSVLYRRPGEIHADLFGPDGAHSLLIEIDQTRLAGLVDLFPNSAGTVNVRSECVDGLPGRLAAEFSSRDRASGAAITGILHEMVARTSRLVTARAARPEPKWFAAALAYIAAHFRGPITLFDIAAAARVHPLHLCREFRRLLGRTVGDCIREQRLGAARRALADTDAQINRIAQDAGFYDQSHLDRAFKRAEGMSPTAFRRRLRDQFRPTDIQDFPSARRNVRP